MAEITEDQPTTTPSTIVRNLEEKVMLRIMRMETRITIPLFLLKIIENVYEYSN
jgi:hypothetical protein